MNRKRIITIVFVLVGVLHVRAQDTIQYISLNQACQMGIDNNLSIANANLETQKAHYQLKETQSKLYPQLDGYSTFNYYFGIPKILMPGEIFGQTGEIPVEIGTKYDWSSGFSASLILYNQSYFTSIKVAKRMQTVSKLSLSQKKEEMAYQVSQVYYLCKTTGSQITFLEKDLKNACQLMEILKHQNENGIARKIDYSKVLVNKNNLQTQIDNLVQLRQQQLGLLKYLIGVELRNKIELSDSLTFNSEVQSSGLPDFTKLSELKLMDEQIAITALNKKGNQQAYLPTLSGAGQFYYQGQQNEFNFFKGGTDKFFNVGYLGLTVNVPIFDGFGKQAKNRQYGIELQQLQNDRKNRLTNYNKDFIDATQQYKNSLKAILRQQENIKIAEDDYNISLQGYRQQVVPLSDVMLSENSLTEARLSYVNALLQLKNAELEVRKSKGELLQY
jgi:outer membrane protein